MTTLDQLLNKHDDLSKKDTEYGLKIHCSTSGIDLLPKVEAIEKHLKSKQYIRAKEEWHQGDWVKEYEPHIVQHKRNESQLYCLRTKKTLNKIKSQVVKHVNGKRFNLRKQEYEEKQAKKKKKQDAEVDLDHLEQLAQDSPGEEEEMLDEDDEEMESEVEKTPKQSGTKRKRGKPAKGKTTGSTKKNKTGKKKYGQSKH